jgi:hypothetical protein
MLFHSEKYQLYVWRVWEMEQKITEVTHTEVRVTIMQPPQRKNVRPWPPVANPIEQGWNKQYNASKYNASNPEIAMKMLQAEG